jgi:hypothetical protein
MQASPTILPQACSFGQASRTAALQPTGWLIFVRTPVTLLASPAIPPATGSLTA